MSYLLKFTTELFYRSARYSLKNFISQITKAKFEEKINLFHLL